MTENEIGKIVVDAAFRIHTRLGPGLLESVYEAVFAYELRKRGLKVAQQVSIPVMYDDL
jgi:GxxExxY protein